MKKVIWVKRIEKDLVEVKIEATKRRKIWLKLLKDDSMIMVGCSSGCPLYHKCTDLPSPLKKYDYLGQFCENLFNDYPDLSLQLATEYGITNLNQTLLIKIKR